MKKQKRATLILCIFGLILMILGCFIKGECATKIFAIGDATIISSILTYLNLKWKNDE